MKRRIATKCYIEFDSDYLLMSKRIKISKAEYDRQMKYLKSLVGSYCYEYQFTEEVNKYDNGGSIEVVHTFEVYNVRTILTIMKCKKGKTFLNNN